MHRTLRTALIAAALTSGAPFVPEGFAQGYQTLVADCEVVYQMTHEYVPAAASGVRWDDPAFGIEWPPAGDRVISERDQAWPDYRPAPAAPPAPAAQPRA